MAQTQSTYNFPPHIKGDTFNGQLFRFSTSNGETSGSIDLTDATAKLQLKESYQSSPAFTFSTENEQITLPNPSNGELQLESTIINIDAGKYIYDLQITFPDESVQTYLRGEWVIINDVTR